jgi:hypothetical protein
LKRTEDFPVKRKEYALYLQRLSRRKLCCPPVAPGRSNGTSAQNSRAALRSKNRFLFVFLAVSR